MQKAKQVFHPSFTIDKVDKRLFGIFLESIGDTIYGKLYNPEHPTADQNGFRTDYMELFKELKPTLIRAPGGNLISGYHWKDAIGPKEQRLVKEELAWHQRDNNHVGIDEFYDYCELIGAEFMIATNMGTGTPEEATDEVDYCNTESGTYWSELRRKNGYEKPHALKLWCVGNEMDGRLWQICSKTPMEYARICEEASKMMKWMDPTIECVACGSCTNEVGMETYGDWDRIVMERCYDYVEYLSIHRYLCYDTKRKSFYPNFHSVEDIACMYQDLESYLKTVTSAADLVKGQKRSNKDIYLSFDEYGVAHEDLTDLDIGDLGWKKYPEGNQGSINLLDALIHGIYAITFLKHCDRVKIACESVAIPNLIGGSKDGGVFRQTNFYVFRDFSLFARDGVALQAKINSPQVDTPFAGKVDAIQSAAVYNEKEGILTVFALNLDMRNDFELENDFQSFGDVELFQHLQLYDDEPLAVNTEENPERIVEKEIPVDPAASSILLPKHSWNVLRYKVK